MSFNISDPFKVYQTTLFLCGRNKHFRQRISPDNWSRVFINFTRPTLHFTRNVLKSGDIRNLCFQCIITLLRVICSSGIHFRTFQCNISLLYIFIDNFFSRTAKLTMAQLIKFLTCDRKVISSSYALGEP